MIRLLFAFALALMPAPALAQDKPPAGQSSGAAQPWRQADGRLIFAPAGVSLPSRAGAASVTQTSEFSNPGETIDNIVQYRSPDGELIVTAYLYYPGLAHTGLSSYATDHAIRLSSGSEVRTLGTQVAAAGGVPGAALRTDYANYRNGYASSAAFIKLDRWMIKLRVSAPERRRAEVEAAMSALLDGIRFEGQQPRQSAPFEVSDCPSPSPTAARLVPNALADAGADAAIAGMDGAGASAEREGGGRAHPASRIPTRWCLSTRARIGDGRVPILRAQGDPPGSPFGRSRLVAIISDAGGMVEVVELPNADRFLVLHHEIGQTALLGSFDAVPSDDQIVGLISGRDGAAAQVRARVHLRPGQGDRIEMVAPPTETPAPVI